MEIFLRCLEGKFYRHDKQHGQQTTVTSHEHHLLEAQIGQQQDGGSRTDGQCQTGEPSRGMVGLSAAERLTLVDDERARQHHLCQTISGPEHKADSQHHIDAQRMARTAGVPPIESAEREQHGKDSPQAHMVAAVMLHPVGTQTAQEKHAHAHHAHGGTHLHGCGTIAGGHPTRQQGQLHIHDHGKQHVGQRQHPEVFVPQVDMNRSILCVHQYDSFSLGNVTSFTSLI